MKDVDLPTLARELIERNSEKFKGLFGNTTVSGRAIRRVHTRTAMRKLVHSCLIPEYRKIPQIVDAVTDYLCELTGASAATENH